MGRAISWCLVAMLLADFAPRLAHAQAPKPAPPPVPVLTRHATNHRDWTVIVDLRLNGGQTQAPPGTVNLAPTARVVLDAATIFFPIPVSSATHEAWDDRLLGRIDVAGRTVVDRPRLLTGYQSFTRLGAWDLHTIDANSMQLHLETPMTSWEVTIDEVRAARIGWPTRKWGDDIAACLGPQLLVESDAPAVTALVDRWMRQSPGGLDAARTRPYVLAKYLCGRVVAHYQPASGAIDSNARGRNSRLYSGALLSGFAVDGAALAAERGRGPELDMAGLMVAAWRVAGIPSRLVIGYDIRAEDAASGAARRLTVAPTVRAWGEFYLFDETTGLGEWIPVDVQRQREFSSRPPPLGQAWKFFGNNEDSDYLCPMSFHWLPPTPCMNIGPPSLWGWVPQPEGVAYVEPDMRVSVKAAARRGDDPKRSTPAPGGSRPVKSE